MKSKNTPQPASRPLPADRDNHSRQLNPEHDAYWRSRGLPGKSEGAEPPVPPPPLPPPPKK